MPSRQHYLSDAAYQRNLESSRRAKARRTGKCMDCGAVTHYSGSTVNGPSDRCVPCAKQYVGKQMRGRGTSVSLVLDALKDGPLGCPDLLLLTGRGNQHLGQILHRLLRYGLIVRVSRGVYALPDEQR